MLRCGLFFRADLSAHFNRVSLRLLEGQTGRTEDDLVVNTVTNAKKVRSGLPQVVQRVRRGMRFTVLHRSRLAFQVIPVDAPEIPTGDVAEDPLYRAKPLGRSVDGRSAADHDALLYGRSLTDCTSFILMRELELREALTTDRHFLQAGIGIKPG